MIDISRTDVYGFEAAIRGMRNPMNSWEKSDSLFDIDSWDLDGRTICDENEQLPSEERYNWDDYGKFWIGPNDLTLMTKLAKAGSEHSKYRRMIIVTCNILAPLYWWKEYDTYKVGTVANSCSTMHKIAAKEFEIDDFSHGHLFTRDAQDPFLYTISVDGHECAYTSTGFLRMTCDLLNKYRERYLRTKEKEYWWQMIQLLPSSYNQKRTVQLSYENLAAIYRQRRDHKLDEWHAFCDWIKTLPYAKEVITSETT